MDAGLDQERWDATRSWVETGLPEAERIEKAVRLRGGWTSQMRRLDLRDGPDGRRSLVLRSFAKPFYLRHAEGLLSREAAILGLLGDTDVPAATLVALDATGEHCDHPSLLMSLLPGSVRLTTGAPTTAPHCWPGNWWTSTGSGCPYSDGRAPTRPGPLPSG